MKMGMVSSDELMVKVGASTRYACRVANLFKERDSEQSMDASESGSESVREIVATAMIDYALTRARAFR